MEELREGEAKSPADVARALIEAGVAPVAAAGFASRRADPSSPSGWEVSAGEATQGPSRIFDLASLTKPMTAIAVARAGLDRATPIGDLVEEARGTASEGTSLELLLAHRSGLEANLPLFEPLMRGEGVDRSAALRAAAAAWRSEVKGPLPAPPVYSDLGYMLAGVALARHLRARDAGEAIEELVLGPLGLRDAIGTARSLLGRGVDFGARVVPTEIVPWRGGEVRGRVHDENAWALTGEGGSGHAGMFGTIDGVLAFAAAALEATREHAWLVQEREGGDLRAGFDGKSREGASSAGVLAGPRTFGHLGFTGTSFWIDPDASALVAVLTNRVHPTRDNVRIRAARPRAHDALWRLATGGRGTLPG